MIKAIIIEDEQLSANELCDGLAEVAPEISIVAIVDSVKNAIAVLNTTQYDLLFMDIHLGDGVSFDIFKHVEIKVPVIFITAYDSYALKAFENQGIDYLLKPFSRADLKRAISKLKLTSGASSRFDYEKLTLAEIKSQYQERFIVNIGEKIRSLTVAEIAYFMADGKYLHLITHQGADYIVDSTLAEVSEKLSPVMFFRINRKFTVSFSAIKDMVRYSANRIKLTLHPKAPHELDAIVSGDRVQDFRLWLNR